MDDLLAGALLTFDHAIDRESVPILKVLIAHDRRGDLADVIAALPWMGAGELMRTFAVNSHVVLA